MKKTLDQLLDFLGYKTILATNGAEVLSTYNQCRSEIDLVITDNSMPVMDEHAVIKALRQLSSTLKIILCSGQEAEIEVDLVQDLEINGKLNKPFSLDTFDEVISREWNA